MGRPTAGSANMTPAFLVVLLLAHYSSQVGVRGRVEHAQAICLLVCLPLLLGYSVGVLKYA